MPAIDKNPSLQTLERAIRLANGRVTEDAAHLIAELSKAGGDEGVQRVRALFAECSFEGGAAAILEVVVGGPARNERPHVDDGCVKKPVVDITPPAKPYTRALLGTFQNPQPVKRDPLVMTFSDLEPGAKLYCINRSHDLAAKKTDASHWVELPWTKNPDTDGRGQLVVTDTIAAQLGIQAGDVLEVFQVDEAKNVSDSAFAVINEDAGTTAGAVLNTPALPDSSTELVGVQKADILPRIVAGTDTRLPGVNVDGLKQRLTKDGPVGRFELTLTNKPGTFALEPASKLALDHPPTFTAHYTQDVKRDGTLEAKTWDTAPGDAVVMRLCDHSTPPDLNRVSARERRIVFAAGRESYVVVENPALGIAHPARAATGLCMLHDRDGHLGLVGAPGAVTPGALIYVRNMSTGKTVVGAAGKDGSFDRNLEASAGDKLSLVVGNAFDASIKADLGFFTVPNLARPQRLGDDVTPVDTGAPVQEAATTQPLPVRVQNLGVSGTTLSFNWAGTAGVIGASDVGASSSATIDAQGVTVVLDAHVTGGYFDDKAPPNGSNGWMSTQLPMDQLKQHQGELPLKVVDGSGKLLASGVLSVQVGQQSQLVGGAYRGSIMGANEAARAHPRTLVSFEAATTALKDVAYT